MTKNFDKIFELMEKSFPENEYRTYEGQKNLLTKKYYKILTKTDESGDPIAFLAYWSMPEFDFIEHLAVNPVCRGGGIGTKIMKELLENNKKPVILEIEIPCDEITTKRLYFYKRLGFYQNEYEYYQKPLRIGAKPLPLQLMSYPKKLSKEDFEKIKACLHKSIYEAPTLNP